MELAQKDHRTVLRVERWNQESYFGYYLLNILTKTLNKLFKCIYIYVIFKAMKEDSVSRIH